MDDIYWKHAHDLYAGVVKKDVTRGMQVLREKWEKNKAWMIPLFDEKGQLSIKVSSDINSTEMTNAFREGARIGAAMCIKKYKLIGEVDNGYAAIKWVQNLVGSSISRMDFAKNQLSEKVPYPGKEGKSLPKGTKITKLIQLRVMTDETLWKEGGPLSSYGYDNAELLSNFLIDVISQVLGILHITNTTAVLSINPVDLMLAGGHSNSSWFSCQNIFAGSFATYAASMICSEVTAIAFAWTNEDLLEHTSLVWPKRLWRSIINFDRDSKSFLLSGQYPNSVLAYVKPIMELSSGLLATHSGDPKEYTQEMGGRISFENSYWTHTDSPNYSVRLNAGSYAKKIVGGSPDIPCLACGKIRKHNSTTRNWDRGMWDDVGNHLCDECRKPEAEVQKEAVPDVDLQAGVLP